MSEHSYETIAYRVEDRVAWLTFDRPDAGNTFSWRMADELVDAFRRADADDDVRVVLISANGANFCLGMDVSGLGTAAEDPRPEINGFIRDGGGQVTLQMLALRKPIIVAIHGAAAGIGVTMTLAADVRIAAESARFALPFTRRGINSEACSSWLLPRTVGISQASEWMLTGRTFDAAEALRGRLVSRVVGDDEVVRTAAEIATEIATKTSPAAVAISRRLLWQMLSEASPWEAHRLESESLSRLSAGPDLAEGVNSFLEKRKPDFASSVNDEFPSGWAPWPSPPDQIELSDGGEPG